MFVSFLVPVYNVEKYLEPCVDSLLVQKGSDYEILLLDDGSTDSSGAICDRYAREYPDRVRVIHKQNEGSFFTRRRGFSEARGDWFICVDSDDYVAPNLLETVLQIIEETGSDMVIYNFYYFDENGMLTPSRLNLKNGETFWGEGKLRIYEKKLLTVDLNMMWMRAIRRDTVDFETDYSNCGIRNMCDDVLQMLPIYTNAQKITYVDTPLYFYRKWSGSTTGRYSFERWEASRVCFQYTERYMKLWRIPEEVSARCYTKHLEFMCDYIRWLFSEDEGSLPASLRELLADLKRDPGFYASMQHYQRKFAHSRYLSILVPLLSRLAVAGNTTGIRFVLGLERQLVRLRKK